MNIAQRLIVSTYRPFDRFRLIALFLTALHELLESQIDILSFDLDTPSYASRTLLTSVTLPSPHITFIVVPITVVTMLSITFTPFFGT